MNRATWRKHYNEEVKRMTNLYSEMNKGIPTKTREITPEEQKQYEQAINRKLNINNPYKLSFNFNT